MIKRRQRGRPPPPPRKVFDAAAPPTLHELDAFSLADIQAWRRSSALYDELYRELHFGLESQRLANRDALLHALRSKPHGPIDLFGWYRLVETRYYLEPLSTAGSALRYGGRFNIGKEVGEGAFGSFPALYLAEDLETAYREFFQVPAPPKAAGLTRNDLALKRVGGFLAAEVHGRIQGVFNVGDPSALRPFVDVISRFEVPSRVLAIARKLGLPRRTLIKTPGLLRRAVLATNWRAWPLQFDIPSNSQVLGRLLRDAGYEAVLYPSSKGPMKCLAIFPENMHASDSFVELSGQYPEVVTGRRLDAITSSGGR